MKKKFGYMKCPDCGARVTVKINDLETLVYACDDCDGSGYCRKAEGRYPSWIAKIERVAPAPEKSALPAPEKVPSQAAAPPPAPAAAKVAEKMPWER